MTPVPQQLSSFWEAEGERVKQEPPLRSSGSSYVTHPAKACGKLSCEEQHGRHVKDSEVDPNLVKEGRSKAERPRVRDMEADEALQALVGGCGQTATTAGLSWRVLAVTVLGQAGEQREQRHGGRRHGLYLRSCVQE